MKIILIVSLLAGALAAILLIVEDIINLINNKKGE